MVYGLNQDNQFCYDSFFFFQAEDGIRDHCVTGVQTCALPIYRAGRPDHGRHLQGDHRPAARHQHHRPGAAGPPLRRRWVGMTRATVLLFLFPAALILLAIVIGTVFRARERARIAGPGTPPSRRPGPTDEALEGRLLENYQLAGVALTIYLAVALPFLYIREPA